MAATKRYEDIPLNIYIPEPIVVLTAVLCFLLGFLYRRYRDHEDIAEAYNEGFEKGANSVVAAVAQLTGQNIEIKFGTEPEDEDDY